MAELFSIDGKTVPLGIAPGANVELVEQLRLALKDAEAGRMVVMAGVLGFIDNGKLTMRFAVHSNNWEVHDRLLARVGILRAMMERDYLDKMQSVETPIISGGDDDSGGDAA